MTRPLLIAILSVAFGMPAAAQSLSPAEIEAAIKAGQSKKFSSLTSDCVATAGFGESMAAGLSGGVSLTGSYDVVVAPSQGRIAYLAAEAKRLYKPFSAGDVTEDMLQPVLYVWVEPNAPTRNSSSGSISAPAPIDRIVLKSKSQPDAVTQPEAFDVEPVEFKNLLGGVIATSRATASFPTTAIETMPAGDIDVVVVTPAGERRCKVGKDDRAKLLKLINR